MELSVGMYVRTKHNGIGKIVEYINDPTHYFFKCYKLDRDCSNCEEYITKADVIGEPSHNIIDLIEEHDVLKLYDEEYGEEYKAEVILDNNGCKCVSNYDVSNLLNLEYELFTNEHIKLISVLTKEQFSQMEYKVGE